MYMMYTMYTAGTDAMYTTGTDWSGFLASLPTAAGVITFHGNVC